MIITLDLSHLDITISEIVGWIIGLGAIGISIGIFIKQRSSEKKINALGKQIRGSSFQRIYENLKYVRVMMRRDVAVIEVSQKEKLEKYAQAKGSTKAMQEYYQSISNNILNEAEFLKDNPKPKIRIRVLNAIGNVSRLMNNYLRMITNFINLTCDQIHYNSIS